MAMKKQIKRLVKIFQGVYIPWLALGVVLVLGIVRSYVELEQTTLTANIIDTSQNTIKTDLLVHYIAVLLIYAAVRIAISYINGWTDEKINCGVRNKLWEKLMRLPTRYYDQESSDNLVSRVTTDTDFSQYYFNIIIDSITAIYATVITVMQMYRYSPQLTAYMLFAVPVLLLMAVLLGKLSYISQFKVQSTLSSALGYLVERTRNLRLIKASRMEYNEQQAGKKLFDRQFRASWLTTAANSLSAASVPAFSCVCLVVSFIAGAYLVRSGEVTVGKLVGFYNLSTMLVVRLQTLLDEYIYLKRANGRLAKVADLLNTPDEKRDGVTFDVADADLVAEDIVFSYGDSPALDHVSFHIPKGQITAIVGANGAGKSTLFKLFERMYDPDEGALRFGHDDVRTFSLDSWRRSFAIVSQDKPLLSGTVRENILYGVKRQVTDEELEEVARLANVYDFVMATPGGFDAPVGMGGSNFSGGQRQCIAIARAMMRNPDYLLLDEATASLDAKSEQIVSQALTNLMKGRTTIMIAHNYSATRDATHIVVMKDGRVEAEGSPEELLETNEYYRAFAGKATA